MEVTEAQDWRAGEMAEDAARFVVTKEHRRFTEFLDTCREDRSIGLSQGLSGVGKTSSARRYSGWNLLWRSVESHDAGLPPAEAFDRRTIFYTAEVTNTPKRVAEDLKILFQRYSVRLEDALDPEGIRPLTFRPEFLQGGWSTGHTEMVIVDEADRLTVPSLEQLRDVHDRTGVALILMGTPEIGRRVARYSQLNSRLGFVHHYKPMEDEETRFVLQRKWEEVGLAFSPDDFDDVEAMAAVVRITEGNLRKMKKLFAQVERVLELNGVTRINKEVVDRAREAIYITPSA